MKKEVKWFLGLFLLVQLGLGIWAVVRSNTQPRTGAQISAAPFDGGATRTDVDVHNWLTGTWTHTAPVSQDREPWGWERWTFAGGTVAVESAKPSDTAWGAKTVYQYTATREKTGDTGEWYWRVRLAGTAMNAAVVDKQAGVVVWRNGGSNNYNLQRGDKDLAK